MTVGIATSFAASFALLPLLPLFDVSLNMLSLFAFMMVIGIVVDDAIVIGESIHITNEQGVEGDDAAIIGVAEVAKPVLFGVLTTMVVFAPMAFLPGSTAEYTRAISIVVVLALSFSILEALLILPSHLRHLKKSAAIDPQKPSKLALIQRRVANSMSYLGNDLYGPFLLRMIKHKYLVITLFVGGLLVAANLLANNYVKQSFMPKIASDKI